MKIAFRDIDRFLPDLSASVSSENRQEIITQAAQDLAARSWVGTFIAVSCFLIGLASARVYEYAFGLSLLLGFTMGISTLGRFIAIVRISRQQSSVTVGCNLLFFAATGMAASWGLLAAAICYYLGNNNQTMFAVVLTAGMSAGAVANFCIWRKLSIIYMLLNFVPILVVSLVVTEHQLQFLFIGVLIYMVYMIYQSINWNSEYWRAQIKSFLFEQQAQKLSNVNRELAVQMDEQKAIHKELDEGRRLQRQLFNNTHAGIIIMDLNRHVLDLNDTMVDMISCGREELYAAKAVDSLAADKDNRDLFLRNWKGTIDQGDTDFVWLATRYSSRDPFYLHINLRKIRWQDREVIFLTARDIHKQKMVELERDHAKDTLNRSQGYLQAILENTTVPIYCKDLEGCYIIVNSRFLELTSLGVEEITGRTDEELFQDTFSGFFNENDQLVVAEKRAMDSEKSIVLGSEKRTFRIFSFPLFDTEDQLFGVGGICTDVSDLKQAYLQADLASRSKTEFLANMSHELRTPMHGILSFARLGLRRTEQVPIEKLKLYFNMIASSGQQLLDLLNNLLDLSMLDSQRMKYNPEKRDVTADIGEIIEEFRAVADERRVVIKDDIESGSLMANYDVVRIKQVVRNILSNGLKFSEEGGRILVSTKTTDGGPLKIPGKVVVVSVADEGIGIPESELESVFDKFVQSSRTKTGAGGTGLGLAICRQIVEYHQGRIWAEKNTPNGVIFSFALPLVIGNQSLPPTH
ncbi:MAG: PAS domain S-box protein [Desulfobulbaceae bacterium]|nr:MAG: PAS domain S-box protein [Desulfobulbaceae bacterium]